MRQRKYAFHLNKSMTGAAGGETGEGGGGCDTSLRVKGMFRYELLGKIDLSASSVCVVVCR